MRVYLPPDANTLLSTADHCLRSRALHQRHRRRQAAGAALADDGRGDRALHARPGHLGLGQHRRRRGARRRAGLLRRRAHPGDARRRATCSASTCPTLQRAGGQRGRPDAAAAADRAPARPARRRVRRPVHHRPAGHLRLPRLPVADPPAHLPAARTTTTCTCAATRRRAPPPRRSTWSCSTTSTASTWSWTSSTGCPGSASARPDLRQQMVDAAPARARLHPRARRGPPRGHRLAVVAGAGLMAT